MNRAKLAAVFQKFQKTVHTLRGNETKATSTNAVIDNLFALKTKKKSKKYKRTLF